VCAAGDHDGLVGQERANRHGDYPRVRSRSQCRQQRGFTVAGINARIDPGKRPVSPDGAMQDRIVGVQLRPGPVAPVHPHDQLIDRTARQRQACGEKMRAAEYRELPIKRVEHVCTGRHVAKALAKRDHACSDCHTHFPRPARSRVRLRRTQLCILTPPPAQTASARRFRRRKSCETRIQNRALQPARIAARPRDCRVRARPGCVAAPAARRV
jgi:hypothetical protein